MLRIDPNALADHLDVALTVAPAATLAKLYVTEPVADVSQLRTFVERGRLDK